MPINSVIKLLGRTGKTQTPSAKARAFLHAEDMQMKTCTDQTDKQRLPGQNRDQTGLI